MKHPVKMYEEFVASIARFGTDDSSKYIEKCKTYKIELSEETKNFHVSQGGKANFPDIMHFDTITLGFFPIKLKQYHKKDLWKDPGYFESGFVCIMDTDGHAHTCEMDPIGRNPEDLFKEKPDKFMWLLKYWNEEIYNDQFDEDEHDDGVYYDDSFSDYDIILCKYDDPLIQNIIQYIGEK